METVSAETIDKGLGSALAVDRVNTLRLIRRHKALAENVCIAAGIDLADRLMVLYNRFKNSSEKWECVFTALQFETDKTACLAKDIFVTHTDNKFMVMAANRLHRMTDTEKVSFLPSILFADNNNNRTRLCANLLAGNSLVDEKTALRVSVISDRKCTAPEFNRQTADIWIEEMQGPYQRAVRTTFSGFKPIDVDLLLTRWEMCDASLKVWILKTVPIQSSDGYDLMLKYILSNETSSTVVIAALQHMLQHACCENFKPVLADLLKHSSQRVRMYAVRCYDGSGRLKMMLAGEKSADVISEIIWKCSFNPENIQLISQYFSHPHWKVRAASVASMVNMAPGSLGEIKKQVFSDCNSARISACKCLYELGMDDWVKEHLG